MPTHYEAACAAVANGEIAVIVVRPPWVGTLTFPMLDCDRDYALSDDAEVRAETMVGLCISGHELVERQIS